MVVPKRKDGMPRSMTQKREREKKRATMSQKKRDRDDSVEKRHHLK